MRACPNLFDLIYQHAAFPLTWELAAVALRSDKHLSLSPSATSDHRINHYLLLSVTSKEDSRHADEAAFTRRDQEGVRHPVAINLLFSHSHYFPFFFLPESPHISLLLAFSRPDHIIFLFHGESSCYLYRTEISSAFKKPSPAFPLSFYPSSYYAIWK